MAFSEYINFNKTDKISSKINLKLQHHGPTFAKGGHKERAVYHVTERRFISPWCKLSVQKKVRKLVFTIIKIIWQPNKPSILIPCQGHDFMISYLTSGILTSNHVNSKSLRTINSFNYHSTLILPQHVHNGTFCQSFCKQNFYFNPIISKHKRNELKKDFDLLRSAIFPDL